MSSDQGDPGVGTPQYRIWVTRMLFKKNGFPSLGSFGQSDRAVVIFDMATWQKLCDDVPQLQTTRFEVGTEE